MGSWAESKGLYRLLHVPEMNAPNILAAHREASIQRAVESGESIILSVQDTTTLNFSTHTELEGQGAIGNSPKTTGLHLHNTLLVGAQSGQTFGLLDSKIYAREYHKRKNQPPGTRNREPIEKKESYRWIESFVLSSRRARELGTNTQLISVGDREADIYELLKEAAESRERKIGLLVRCQHNRKLEAAEGEKSQRLWQELSTSPEQGRVQLTLPRTRGIQPQQTELSIRYREVELESPAHKKKYQGLKQSVRLTILELKENKAKGLHWRLLTTQKIKTLEEAQEIARWYSLRWQIEVLHRVLKTGCRVEKRQLREMDRLKPMIALDLIVSCYLMGMVSHARSSPESLAREWLGEEEVQALIAYQEKEPAKTPGQKTKRLELAQAVKWIAQLGGHLGRKNDGPPGAEVLWRGLQKLQAITEAWRIFQRSG